MDEFQRVNHKKEIMGQGDSEAGCTGTSKKDKKYHVKKNIYHEKNQNYI